MVVPEGKVLAIAADSHGVIWIATGTGVARFDGTRWSVIGEDWGIPSGEDWGIPSGEARYIHLDREHRLWVATADALFYLPAGERRFQNTGLRVKWIGEIAQNRAG